MPSSSRPTTSAGVHPARCAHGFQALEDGCELLYQHTAPYTPDCEDGCATTTRASRSAGRCRDRPVVRDLGFRSSTRLSKGCTHEVPALRDASSIRRADVSSTRRGAALERLPARTGSRRGRAPLSVEGADLPDLPVVQVDEVQRHEALFSDDYVYFSSYSSSWVRPAQRLSRRRSSSASRSARSRR
jgi:hypothetical protein